MSNQPVVGYRSFRLSIRWLPEEASEPTSTIVLTGARSGIFVDTRLFKEARSSELDWAIAGYRTTDPSFEEVEDKGTNSILPDGNTLEVGEMVNPDTGKMTPFEEVWRDEEEMDGASVLFVKNTLGTVWQGRVGNVQIGLGRAADGVFWAWQAQKELDGAWVVKHSTSSVVKEKIAFLSEHQLTGAWEEGSSVEWEGEQWVVLERGRV
ncbi:hypothetical protein DXG01_004470 [Tephrocybe rancida]|nr:hypothetical protein DXG01_004470 [Tephrocybe rancida]